MVEIIEKKEFSIQFNSTFIALSFSSRPKLDMSSVQYWKTNRSMINPIHFCFSITYECKKSVKTSLLAVKVLQRFEPRAVCLHFLYPPLAGSALNSYTCNTSSVKVQPSGESTFCQLMQSDHLFTWKIVR